MAEGFLGSRPNTDEVLMVKLLVLQQWYGLSDMELERQAAYRLDSQNFLGWPERPPDYSTVWQFRERLAATMTDAVLWGELQRQLDEAGLKVRKGVAQDASFIEADPGAIGEAAWWGGGYSEEQRWGLGEEAEGLRVRLQAAREDGSGFRPHSGG